MDFVSWMGIQNREWVLVFGMGIEWSISRTLIPGDSKIDFPWNPFHVTSWNRPSSDVLCLFVCGVIGDLFFKIRWWRELLIGENSIIRKDWKKWKWREKQFLRWLAVHSLQRILYSQLVSIWRQRHKTPMRQRILVYDTKPHVTYPVALLHTASTGRNLRPHKLFLWLTTLRWLPN
jgi:hypothetical protein